MVCEPGLSGSAGKQIPGAIVSEHSVVVHVRTGHHGRLVRFLDDLRCAFATLLQR